MYTNFTGGMGGLFKENSESKKKKKNDKLNLSNHMQPN